MNYRQATWLRPGLLIRRKEPFVTRNAATECAVLIVDRIEYPTRRQGEVTVHAGGQIFKACEIERVIHR
jgi:hypothetical protein